VTGDVNVTGMAINCSTATGEATVPRDQLVLRNIEVSLMPGGRTCASDEPVVRER